MIRTIASAVALALIPVTVAFPARAAQGNAAPKGVIISLTRAGRCLDATRGPVRVTRCRQGAAGQAWRAYDPVEGIRIRQVSGPCLTVTAKARVVTARCGGRGQRWSPRGAFSLHPWRFAGKCLAVTRRGRVFLAPCRTRRLSQRWDWVRPAG